MSLKLYRCHTIPAPPYEKGTYCIPSTDRGFVLATSEQGAESQILEQFKLDPKQVCVRTCYIKRYKKAKEEIREKMKKNSQKMRRLCEQNELLAKWMEG